MRAQEEFLFACGHSWMQCGHWTLTDSLSSALCVSIFDGTPRNEISCVFHKQGTRCVLRGLLRKNGGGGGCKKSKSRWEGRLAHWLCNIKRGRTWLFCLPLARRVNYWRFRKHRITFTRSCTSIVLNNESPELLLYVSFGSQNFVCSV